VAGAPHLRRQVAGLGAVALTAAALAGPALVGGSEADRTAPPASATAGSYEHVVVGARALRPMTRREAAPARAGLGRKKDDPGRFGLSYYIGVDFQEVEAGGAQLFEIRCPTKGEQPIAGGTFAPVAGLVSVTSSRVNPSTSFPTRPRAWYQGVVNIMNTPLRWKPFVTCGTAKGVIP
jgi:hypothetical protein